MYLVSPPPIAKQPIRTLYAYQMFWLDDFGVSEWLLFNVNFLAIFQLYDDVNMFVFNEMTMMSALY